MKLPHINQLLPDIIHIHCEYVTQMTPLVDPHDIPYLEDWGVLVLLLSLLLLQTSDLAFPVSPFFKSLKKTKRRFYSVANHSQ